MTRAVFFDFGETLATIDPSFEEFLSEFVKKAGGLVSLDSIKEVFRKGKVRQRAERIFASEERLKGFWIDFYMEVLVVCQVPPMHAEEIAQTMWTRHLVPSSYRLYPDAIPTLEALKRRGLIVGVLSNFDQSLHDKLRYLGLSTFLDHVFVSSAIRVAKPDSNAFLHLCTNLDLDSRDLLYIGDDLENDYYPCQLLGIRSLIVDRSSKILQEVPTIKSLLDVENYL